MPNQEQLLPFTIALKFVQKFVLANVLQYDFICIARLKGCST